MYKKKRKFVIFSYIEHTLPLIILLAALPTFRPISKNKLAARTKALNNVLFQLTEPP